MKNIFWNLYCWMNEIESENEYEAWCDAVVTSGLQPSDQECLLNMGGEINEKFR